MPLLRGRQVLSDHMPLTVTCCSGSPPKACRPGLAQVQQAAAQTIAVVELGQAEAPCRPAPMVCLRPGSVARFAVFSHCNLSGRLCGRQGMARRGSRCGLVETVVHYHATTRQELPWPLRYFVTSGGVAVHRNT